MKKINILVIRFDNLGKPVCSKPCNACLAIIHRFNIKHVYYIDSANRLVRQRPDEIRSYDTKSYIKVKLF